MITKFLARAYIRVRKLFNRHIFLTCKLKELKPPGPWPEVCDSDICRDYQTCSDHYGDRISDDEDRINRLGEKHNLNDDPDKWLLE